MKIQLISLLSAIVAILAYPVPTPLNGRYDVHGWLILPIEQSISSNSLRVEAYLSHHVPEFYTNSPHNFHIIIKGVIESISPTNNPNDAVPLNIPIPPTNSLNGNEYSFTPPSPFSLNNLLNHDIKYFNGIYYNGTFDGTYPREQIAVTRVKILDIVTANYLNETNTDFYTNLQYLVYPIGANSNHYYLSHDIHTKPDFYHTVEGTLDCVNSIDRIKEGSQIIFPDIANIVSNRLKKGQVISAELVKTRNNSCKFTVLEDIHCKVGPGFMMDC